MIACYAWSNLQIINITNAALNLYPDSEADLFVRMGPHVSNNLLSSVEKSGAFRHVFYLDPLVIDCRLAPMGRIPLLRAFGVKKATQIAYDNLLSHMSGETAYERVLLPWFFADSIFLLKYWKRFNPKLTIGFVEEGTSSYCYTQKQMCFSMFNAPSLKAKLKRYAIEGPLTKRLARDVDTLCVYRPEYCRPDITFNKRALPIINRETNPVMYQILCGAASILPDPHFNRYDKRNFFYFSSYSVGNPAFEEQCSHFLDTLIDCDSAYNVICKVHTHATTHAQNFASHVQSQVFVDREAYIFEGLFMQLAKPEQKALISCVSTTSINPKFMFGVEPYIILTHRLYNGYRQNPVERDDWMANSLIDAYEDKSKVMIPNSMREYKAMIKRANYNNFSF